MVGTLCQFTSSMRYWKNTLPAHLSHCSEDVDNFFDNDKELIFREGMILVDVEHYN